MMMTILDGRRANELKGTTLGPYHPSLVQVCCADSDEKIFKHFFIRSCVKTMSADGDHLEFPIGTRNVTFVEVHPMITHVTYQFNCPSAFVHDEL